jgi:hypothetical protein
MRQSLFATAPKSELAFIGSLLRLVNDDEYDRAHEAATSIEPDDFHETPFRDLFCAFRKLLQTGEPFDCHLLVAECNGSVDNPAGLLLEAGESIATAVHIAGHAKVIRKAADQRRAVCIVQDTLNELGKTTDAVQEISKLRQKLDKLIPPEIRPVAIAPEAYMPFPVSALPNIIANYVSAASHAIGCDASFIAIPLLGCLARAIGNKRVIRLKRTWTEPAIIWAAIVGKSGTHKSPAIAAATSFLQHKQAESITAYQESLDRFVEEKALYERDYAAWKRSKKATTEPPPWPPQEPVCERFITTDCTIEALAFLLHGQFDGVLVPRDELAGWLGGIAEYKGGKGSDLGHWLSMWSAAPLTVDRKTGAIKMIHVPRAAVSIVGGIQPGVLRQAIGHEHMQDGLCARMLLAMPDPKPVRWTDAIVDPPVYQAIVNLFDRLLCITPGADADGNPEPFALPLSAAAKPVWIEFYNRHRGESTGLDDDLAAAWSKLEAYAARFALIFELCSSADASNVDAVDVDSLRAGIMLAEWFGGEAKRVYSLFTEAPGDRERRELIELIDRKGGEITPRELHQSSRKHRPIEAAEDALDSLVKAGLGRWVVITGRKPKRVFRLAVYMSTSTLSRSSAEISTNVDVDSVDAAEVNSAI